MSKFRVWTCPNLYDFEFTEIEKCDVTSFRKEAKGLGSAVVKIDLSKYNIDNKNKFEAGQLIDGVTDTSPGRYIFIQTVDNSGDEDDDTDLTKPSHESVIWFGYISARSLEVQTNSNDTMGTLECLEIGHVINKFSIRLPRECRNGFNPVVDGEPLGNKRMLSGVPALVAKPSDLGKNPLTETAKYWTVREVVDYLVHYGSPFLTLTDWSLMEDFMEVGQPSRWLEQYETIPSYENEDLTSALEDILDTLSWDYYWSEDDELTMRFFDPVGGMDDEYIDGYYIPDNAIQFNILSEEQSYDRVVLRGNRILVAGSVSTYGKHDSLKLNPDWTEEERNKWVDPTNSGYNILNIESSIDTSKQEELINTNPSLTAEEKERQISEIVSNEVKKTLDRVKAEREKLPNVYQHFTWGLADPLDVTKDGDMLATHALPGNWYGEKQLEGNTSIAIPFFPWIKLQKDTINTEDKIDNVVFDVPVVSDVKTLHQTPIPTEMEFEDTVPWAPYEKTAKWYNEPHFYYRTFGNAADYGQETAVYEEAWMYGDFTADGLMASEFALDWEGVKLKSPQPESFAWSDNCIYQRGNTDEDEYDTQLEDYDVDRDEWKQTDVLSDYDPERKNFRHKGHWGRMIFSFAARSNQRLEVSYGDTTSTDKTKFEEDDTLELWLVRKGFVPYLSIEDGIGGDAKKVPGFALPYYNPQDKFTRNDLPKAKERLKTLWNFWSKPKRAVSIVIPAFNDKGNLMKPGVVVGQFLDQITDKSTKWNVNSYVASVEYNLDYSRPNIVITTEYPASPRRTREKRVKSARNFTRFGKAPSNQGAQ